MYTTSPVAELVERQFVYSERGEGVEVVEPVPKRHRLGQGSRGAG